VDSVWEQEKLEARKMPKNAARTHPQLHPVMIAGNHFPREKPASVDKSILRKGRSTSSPSGKAVETRGATAPLQSRAAPWFPVRMIHPLVAGALAP